MLRGQDIIVLVALGRGRPALPRLAERLGLSNATVHRSLERLREARLTDADGMGVNGLHAEEFLVHGLRYVFPPRFGGEVRGVPTAWAAAVLAGHLVPGAGSPPVWAHPSGTVRGMSLEPLHPVVPALALDDPDLGAVLALLDAIRIGDARLRAVAADLLRARLLTAGKPVR